MAKKSIIIADDHPVFRLGLAHIINDSDGFSVVAEADNVPELYNALETVPCEFVILDMKMPESMNGMQALEKIKTSYPEKKVMIMSQMCSPDLVQEAMELGAEGYVTKNDITDTILPFLKCIDKGERVLSPRIQSMLINIGREVVDPLTPRELDILRLSADGLSRKEIAGRLDISLSTVNFHRQNIKDKLQAKTLAEMISIAHEKGLV